jgi:hypothetical protein
MPICVCCGSYIPEGEGMVCPECLANDGPMVPVKRVIRIENSYRIWLIKQMRICITLESSEKYNQVNADKALNRSWRGMYIEWYLHNIGYYLTLPFIKNNKIKALNERFKHVDLEEHYKKYMPKK